MMTISGRTPSNSLAKSLPVRPRPVWISSVMSRTLFFLQISAARLRKPSVGMRIPASAWMGSTRNAAVFGVMAFSRASASPKGLIGKPGVKGPKSCRYSGSVEKLITVTVRPWKLLAQQMISALSWGTPFFWQAHGVAGQIAELLGQLGPLVVAEGARGERQLAGLLDESPDDAGVTVALVDGRVGAQEVEVLAAFDVVHPDALGLADDDVERMVIVGAVEIFDQDEVFAIHVGLLWTGVRGGEGGIRTRGTPYGAHTLS